MTTERSPRRSVFISSPYSGNIVTNTAYAMDCMLDSVARGEAPFAPHLLYPKVLNDLDPLDRQIALMSGVAWMARAELVAFYLDYGWSAGMDLELQLTVEWKLPIELRRIN